MHHLAQLNIARMKYAPDASEFADFVAALEPVNASADSSPGFVWRLVSEDNDSSDLAAFEAQGWLVNMSVWEKLEDLKSFIRSPAHLAVMKRRAEWFRKVEVYMCLWWVPVGHLPGFSEARSRLEHLRLNGPTVESFNFARSFPPPTDS
jgi:hypothetical protein